MPVSRAVPVGRRFGVVSAGVVPACWVVVLLGVAVLTWRELAAAAGGAQLALPQAVAPSRVLLVGVALGAVAGIGVLVGRRPPPGLPFPRAVPPAGAAAVLVGAELRGHPADAVLTVGCIALVLAEMVGEGRRPGGVALGVAIAVQPTFVLFAVVLWLRRRRGAAAVALAVAAAVQGVVFGADPAGAAARWERLTDAAADLGNQSLPAVLSRLGLAGPGLVAGWLALAVLVAVVAVRRARVFTADGQPLLALGVVGCAATAAAAYAGPADLGWLLLAATGRLGRRPEDRALWPVAAVMAALLPSSLFDPHIEPVTSFLLRNTPAMVLLAAAAALPFRRRGDPLWVVRRVAAPEVARPPFGLRGLPLLPAGLRPVSRPNLLLELLLIQVGYGIYTWIRNAVPDRTEQAVAHAMAVVRVERILHVDVEHLLNAFALRTRWVLEAGLQYYKSLHFAVPLAVLVWLYLCHPERYRTGRTVLFAATGLALLGFWGYPLAPPRLTPGAGMSDTLPGKVGTAPLGALTALTNQYAAMPSLHVAWAGWCALVVVTTSRSPWARGLALTYPVLTLFVVVSTANHWVLDAVGGAAVLLAGAMVQYSLTGRLLVDRAPPTCWQN
ncbi:phosphatase PAP2 family protein [Kitasatospora cinereorecta]|uniref:Phosphatase PAP2 family protein n=1 Tax=Kitasatospora cinereorecta TaxID=285560 RepID=A0ABW0VFV5_9ACTN